MKKGLELEPLDFGRRERFGTNGEHHAHHELKSRVVEIEIHGVVEEVAQTVRVAKIEGEKRGQPNAEIPFGAYHHGDFKLPDVVEIHFVHRTAELTFLCGADVNNQSTGRYKMARLFERYPRYEILYPEDPFDDLLAGQGQHSLLVLENILADSVDSIVFDF